MTLRRLLVVGVAIAAFVGSILLTQMLFFRDKTATDAATTPTKTTSVIASPRSLAPSPSPIVVPCDKKQFMDVWQKDDGRGKAEVSTLLCRKGYAYVVFTGDQVGVHGTQSALFRLENGQYKDVAWGSTSHGALQASDIPLNLGPREIAKTFPEAGIALEN